MSKYEPLWQWIVANKKEDFTLTYAEMEAVLGFPVDHSFLTFKKELLPFGFEAVKISMKEQTIAFCKV